MSSGVGTAQGTSTFSMSLGLAAILNERDLTQTTVTSSPCSKQSEHVNSNPTRVSSIISDSHYDLAKNKMASVYTSSSSQGVRLSTQASPTRSAANADPKSDDQVNQSVIFDRLKHTGTSIYGFLRIMGEETRRCRYAK